MSKHHHYLLDTHIWIWFVLGHEKLSKHAHDVIAEASKNSALYLSGISLWETAMLEKKGRIVLQKDCRTWINEALSIPGLTVEPITPEIAVDSTRLPGEFHGDPADRIIVATARSKDATLITQDSKILEYCRNRHVKCLTDPQT